MISESKNKKKKCEIKRLISIKKYLQRISDDKAQSYLSDSRLKFVTDVIYNIINVVEDFFNKRVKYNY